MVFFPDGPRFMHSLVIPIFCIYPALSSKKGCWLFQTFSTFACNLVTDPAFSFCIDLPCIT